MKDVIKIIVVYYILSVLCAAALLLGTESEVEVIAPEYSKDGLEIERKWLINESDIPYDLTKADKFEITQTYINYNPEIRVRAIENSGITYYTMTIKRYVNDEALVRSEQDFTITQEEYESTVVRGLDNTIEKTRYQIEVEDLTYAFDIFKGSSTGLAYMEIEFESEEQANSFQEPDWIIKDITNDRDYKNQSLAQYGIPYN